MDTTVNSVLAVVEPRPIHQTIQSVASEAVIKVKETIAFEANLPDSGRRMMMLS